MTEKRIADKKKNIKCITKQQPLWRFVKLVTVDQKHLALEPQIPAERRNLQGRDDTKLVISNGGM